MHRNVQLARTSALRTFLGVRRLGAMTRTLERSAGPEAGALASLATTMDTLAYQAQAAVRGHAGCLVAAELAAAHPSLGELAASLAQAAEHWAAILETIARAALGIHAA